MRPSRISIRKNDMRCFLVWMLSIVVIIWFKDSTNNLENCVNRIKLKHNNIRRFENSKDGKVVTIEDTETFGRNTPIIFVGGVPRSGTTLMRAMLDAHPDIRCGEETRFLPNVIGLTNLWLTNTIPLLKKNYIKNETIESALGSFVLEIVKNHGIPAKHLCNKDPFVLRYSTYVKRIFPKSKFILMLRDGRATVHSIITRKVTITGFSLESYKESLMMWSKMIEKIYKECIEVGPESCMPVYYEQLVLHPEKNMRKILNFLDISFDDAVLNHEQFIGKEILLSKVERSTDQVIKPVNLEALNSWVGKIPQDVVAQMDTIAPMLRRLGYDPTANPPNYGKPDAKIKENTLNVKLNPEYWESLAKKYSIWVKNGSVQVREFDYLNRIQGTSNGYP